MESQARKIIKLVALGVVATSIGQTIALNTNASKPSNLQPERRVILFIWDGLRPDSISAKDTPNLYQLKQQGSWFSDNHSSYPTFTMMNAASFATGNLAGKTGFYGNTLWDPRATGTDAEGNKENFNIPVFTEDYKVLQDMDQPDDNDPVFFSSTLFSIAHRNGISTAAIGKSGAAFIQNYHQEAGFNGIVLDEKHVYPLELAKQLEENGYPIPKYSPLAFAKGHLALNFDNGNPTGFSKVATLKVISGGALGQTDDFMFPDNVTPDPTATIASPYSQSNEYLMDTYLDKILPKHNPRLTVIWLRNPDTTEHNYGVGSPSYFTALFDQDLLLGKLIKKLKELKLYANTDILIASDHSHSNVSGPFNQFPLRFIHNGMVSVPAFNGYSSSGDFRPADLLARAGFNAYDGHGCEYDPVLSGIKADGTLVYPISTDKNEIVCGKRVKVNDDYGHRDQLIGHIYTTPSHQIPEIIPKDAVIVAGNGGSTYFYVVNHDHQLVEKLTRYLQGRQEFGAIFVDDRFADIPGVLPMSIIHVQNPQGRNPDIIASSSFDDNAVIRGMNGIEFNSSGTDRGMHGSFSRTDIHNTLLAVGPDFKEKFIDTLPSANIDVAPTIAHLLRIQVPNTDGRPLLEALKNGLPVNAYSVLKLNIQPSKPASNLTYQLATDPNGKDVDPSKTNYTINLHSKLLLVKSKSYKYFDSAKAKRY